jgi:glucose-6-phosphate isomerase
VIPVGSARLASLAPQVDSRLAALDADAIAARIWRGDPSVWVDDPNPLEIRDRLGWLHLPVQMRTLVGSLAGFAADVRAECTRVVLCGMGGSSLAPEVLARAFGPRAGFPTFHMLDSTNPHAVAAIESGADMDSTLFVIASKSGSTIETESAMRRFWRGRGDRFVAITDPGSPLETQAHARSFRRVFTNPADVGGRYSALSLFGLVPAALVGIDVAALLERGAAMAAACGPDRAAGQSPGLWLGAVLGEAARAGRDKLTLVCAPPLAHFGAWVEQLVAESSGKQGRGIVPVVDEPLGPPSVYGSDRLFVAVARRGAPDVHAAALDALAAAGHPVVRLEFDAAPDLGAEFFRWEMATAVACAILRVNAFDQPNVAESKRNTLEVLAGGAPPAPPATLEDARRLLAGLAAGDYLAILAYVAPTPEHDRRLGAVRRRWRDRARVATTVGYGPRYLHSTGQLHKGGPPRGRFVIVTAGAAADVDIPGQPWGFATLEQAQAEGDRRALAARRLPVVRLDGLEALEAL